MDYALVQKQLAECTSVQTEWAVPWRPHALVSLTFELDAATRIYRQPCPFPAMPRTPDIDFRPWSTYTSLATAIQLYDIEPNQEAQSLADWVSITEQYLLQEHPWQPQGCGYWVQAAHTPLAKPPAGPMWRRGKPAYWEQLKARLQLALQAPAGQYRPITGFLHAAVDAVGPWPTPFWTSRTTGNSTGTIDLPSY